MGPELLAGCIDSGILSAHSVHICKSHPSHPSRWNSSFSFIFHPSTSYNTYIEIFQSSDTCLKYSAKMGFPIAAEKIERRHYINGEFRYVTRVSYTSQGMMTSCETSFIRKYDLYADQNLASLRTRAHSSCPRPTPTRRSWTYTKLA